MKFTRLSSVAACGIGSFVVALVFVTALSRAAFAQKDPFIGTWKLNVAKSTFDPGPPPRSQTLTNEQVVNGEKRTAEIIDANGTRRTIVVTAKFDGEYYPVAGNPNADAEAIKRIDAYTAEATLKKAGNVMLRNGRVVSRDGKVLTLTQTGINARGQSVHNVLVFEKQ